MPLRLLFTFRPTEPIPVTERVRTHRSNGDRLDTNELKNFRPITNLSTISKIIERLALSRLKPFITSSVNFGQLQSAYRQGHSTESALNNIFDDMLSDIDSGSVVAVMSLDIYAAFDAVDHSILLQRLED